MGTPHKVVEEQVRRNKQGSAWRNGRDRQRVEPMPVSSERPVTRYRIVECPRLPLPWHVVRAVGDSDVKLSEWPTQSEARLELMRVMGLGARP